MTHDITQYTVSKVFEEVGKKTPIAVRFSQVAGNLGSADTVRDPRGKNMFFYNSFKRKDIPKGKSLLYSYNKARKT